MTAAPPVCEVDHLVVAAATLDIGIDYVEAQLGVRVPLGGKHAIMNTHNAVMRLGPDVYFEIIAADEAAGPPQRPRWFALDHPEMRARLAVDGAFLATWVARTPSLSDLARATRLPIGDITAMSRGTLHWQAAIRSDGSLLEGGLFPGLIIEWPQGPHPMERMSDLGLVLDKLTLRPAHPERLRADLASLGIVAGVEVAPVKRGHSPIEASIRAADGSSRRLAGGGTPLPDNAICG